MVTVQSTCDGSALTNLVKRDQSSAKEWNEGRFERGDHREPLLHSHVTVWDKGERFLGDVHGL